MSHRQTRRTGSRYRHKFQLRRGIRVDKVVTSFSENKGDIKPVSRNKAVAPARPMRPKA